MTLWTAIRGRMTMPSGNASKIRKTKSKGDSEREQREEENEREQRQDESDYFLVQEVQRNIFDEPVLVTRRKKRKRNPSRRPDESFDVLGGLVARHCSDNPQFTPRFIPGGGAILPNATLEVDPIPDDISAMTPNTSFQGYASVAQTSGGTGLVETAESFTQPLNHWDEGTAAPAQTMQDCLDHSLPDLPTLREIVEQLVLAGSDAEAINVVTQTLIVNNATSMSTDVAIFCLTTLVNMGGKSKAAGKIISEGNTFDAAIETMELYSGKSAEVHTKACELLWSLSVCGCQ